MELDYFHQEMIIETFFWNRLLPPLTYPGNTSVFVPVTWLPPDHHPRKFSVHEYLGVHHILSTGVCALRVLSQFKHADILCFFSCAWKINFNFLSFFKCGPQSRIVPFDSVWSSPASWKAFRGERREEKMVRWLCSFWHLATRCEWPSDI